MDDKSKVKKETGGGPPPRKVGISLAAHNGDIFQSSAYYCCFFDVKGKLKFAPKAPVKKAAKVVPKKYVIWSTSTFLNL